MFSSLVSLLDSFGIARHVRRRALSIFSRPPRWTRRREYAGAGLGVVSLSGIEPLELKRLFAVDIDLVGTVLTVAFDDAAADSVSLSINATGYVATGANTSSAISTITELVVIDTGTKNTSSFTLLDASQTLSDGLSVDANVTTANLATDIDASGGNVTVDSASVTLGGNVTSGGPQVYSGDVTLARNVTLTSTGAGGWVSDYANPTLITNVSTTQSARNVVLSPDEQYAFVSASTAGLVIVDVSDPSNLTVVSTTNPGRVMQTSLSSDGQLAYIANIFPYSMPVLNVADPSSPSTVGNVSFGGSLAPYATAVSPDDSLVYVGLSTGPAGVFSVIDANTLSEFASLNLTGSAEDIKLSADGRYAFVASGYAGLTVINLTGGTPTVESVTDTRNYALAVALTPDGAYAFTADKYDGVQVIDLSNLASPFVVTDINTTGNAFGVTVSADGRYLFVADDYAGGLQILDIADPTAPVPVGSLDTPGDTSATALTADGRYAFVADGVDGGLLSVALGYELSGTSGISFGGTVDGGYSLTVNDGANGTTTFAGTVGGTTPLASLTTDANGTTSLAANVTVAGPIIFGDDVTLTGNVTVTSTGSETLDYSNLSLVATAATDGSAYDVVLSADGSRAYVAISGAGMSIFDVSNDANPVQLGSYQLFNNDGYARNVALSSNGQYVFLAVPGGTEHNLQIVDVSDPSNPTFVGGYNQSISSAVPNLYDVALSSDGRYAYLGYNTGDFPFQILDLSNLASPTLVGSYNGTIASPFGYAMDVDLSSDGRYAFVTSEGYGLQIIDVANAASPTYVGNLAQAGFLVLEDLALSPDEQFAYVAGGNYGLSVVDLSNLANPQITGQIDTSEYAIGVAVGLDPNYVFVADGYGYLLVMDVTDSANPVLLTNLALPGGFSQGIAVAPVGSPVYVANAGGGMAIVELATADSGGSVRFGSTVDGGHALVVNASGSTTFAGEVGGTTPLASLTTDANGTTTLAANVTTAGNQSYGDVVTLAASTELTGANGSFAGGADGNGNDLTLNFAGTAAISGGFADIANFTVTGNATLCGNITTTGEQDYQGDVELTCNVTLTSTSGSGWVSDYANPTNAALTDTPGSAFGVVLSADGRYAFISDFTSGLTIADLANPLNPSIVSTTDTNGSALQTALSSDDQFAFVADSTNGMQIINVSDPGSPTLAGRASGGCVSISSTALSLDNTRAFLGSSGALDVFLAYNVSNVSSPTFAGVQCMTGDVEQIVLSADGQYAFVATGTAGLTVINLAGGPPSVVSVTDTPGQAFGVTLSLDGHHAFVADYTAGIQIFDVSNVAGPSLVATYDTPDKAMKSALSSDGRYLFVADMFYGGLQILDVSDVANPTFVGNLATPDDAMDVALSADGKYAFVALKAAGLMTVALGYDQSGTSGISFRGTVDGGYSLTVNDGDNGTTTFAGEVGGTTPLTTLTTDANGTVELGANVTTTGNQSFGDVVNLAAATVLTGGTGTFAVGVAGNANDLTLNFSGRAEIDERFTDINNLTSTGDALLCGNITTIGAQDYQADVELECNTTLTSGGSRFVPDYANPSLAGNLDTPRRAQGLTLSSDGQYSFVADTWAGLQIIDVSNVANPSLAGNLDTSSATWGVTLSSNGQYAFVADGYSGLQIIDVSNVANPSRVGNLDTSGKALGVTLSSDGQYAFVADWYSGLQIIDVSNVANPSRVGNLDTSSGAIGVTLSSDGQYAFVADWYSGLQIIDVSNVANPSRVGNLDTSGSAHGVTLSSDGLYAFVADYRSGLQIVDVSNVASPSLVGSLDTSGRAYGVTLSADSQYAFVADLGAGLQIIDVSNVANPVIVGNLDMSGDAFGVTLSSGGRYAFVADGYSGLQIVQLGVDVEQPGAISFGGRVDGGYTLTVNDIGNGTTTFSGAVGGTTPLTSLTTNANGTTFLGANVTVAGPIAFGDNVTLTTDATVTSTGGGSVFVPDYANASLAGTLDTSGYAYGVSLSSDGGYAFVADGGAGLQIVDVSNVASPSLAGNLGTSGEAVGVTLSSNGQYAFVADGSYGLQIIDVSDVALPTLVGNLDPSGYAEGVAVSSDGRYVFVAAGTVTLQIIDVSNVASPTLAGNLDVGLNSNGLTLSSDGRYAFVADGDHGLQIIDVSNVASPILVSNFATSGPAYGVALSSDGVYAFVADYDYGLQIIDVSNVASPTLAGNFAVSSYAFGVALSSDGGYAFVAYDDAGLQIINVSNVASPTQAGNLDLGGSAHGVTLSSDGRYAFVADGNFGLRIVSLGSIQPNPGDVSFGGTVNGGYSLTVNDGDNGTTTFSGEVGGTTPLAALATDANGTTSLGGNVTTIGNQSYGDTVQLLGDTTLVSGAGVIATAGVTDGGGGYGLTVGDANQTGGVVFGGNLALASLTSAAGSFDVAVSGANNSLGTASFTNSGSLTLGASASSRTYAAGGLTAPGVATTFLAGNVLTDSTPITLNATSLTANAVLDSTNGGASNGAAILLANGTQLNGFRLETSGGQSDTEVTGDTVISDGELIVETGSLNLGTPGQAGTLTANQDTLIQVSNGALNIFAGSTIAAGVNNLTLQLDSLNVEAGAGNITAGSITVTPATAGRTILLGSATGTGLAVNQNAFDAFQTPVITIGGGGYNGTVDVGNLTVPQGRLDIIANGTGGSVRFEGDFVSTASNLPGGIAVYVQGSGATTTLNGSLTTAGAVVIDDAVVTDGSHAINTSSTNANITITGGTDGIYGAANQTNSLTINAGTGAVILGNQTGFGDNGGTGSLIENLTIAAGSTRLGDSTSEINGTLSVLTGTLALEGNFTAGEINVASVAGTTLAGNASLVADGNIAFAGTIDGPFALALATNATTTLSGAIGNSTPLTELAITGGSTNLGGNVTTTDMQVFATGLFLDANLTLAGEAAIIRSVEGGEHSLVLDYLCGTSLGAGGVAAENLASLSVINGLTGINGSIETSGSQSYLNGSVSLTGPTTLQGSSVVVGKTLYAGGHDLTLNFTSPTTIDSSFSNLANLTSLGPVALSGQIDSTGFQNYAAAATLAADTTLNATGNIDFGSLVDGARQLTLQSGGNVSFFAALGGTTPLQGLNLASAAAVTALSTLAIDGTGGTGAGLRIGDGVNNLNITQTGSTITNATLSGILLAGDSTRSGIGGFTITNSGSHGIEAAGGNYSGTVISSSSITGSTGDGFHAANATRLVASNLHSAANAKAGFRVAGSSSSVTIYGSLVGLDANGTAAQPNLGQGIIVSGANGTTIENNTISGNAFYGVVVNAAANGTTVTGNKIGVGTDGTTAIGNGQSGVFVLAGATGTTIVGNQIKNNNGMAGIQVVDGTSNTTIGGRAGDSNLLVGNGLFGITVSGNVPGTRVLGNLISSHTTANLYLNNAQNLTVGSATAGEENTFDGSDYGVYAGGDLTGTTIQGNTFQQHTLGGMVLTEAGNLTVSGNTLDDNGAYGIYGTGNLTGTVLQGNTISNHTVGVLVDNGANLTIGSATGTGTSDPDANVITKNTSAGVVVNGAGSQNVSILSNSIFENDFIGISLSAGGNALARTPTLASASTTAVTGSITGTDGDVYRIQYFKSAADVTSGSRFAQGQELIGWQDVTIAGGRAALNFDLTGSSVIVTDWITATATLLVGGLPSETSQFSFGIRVTA